MCVIASACASRTTADADPQQPETAKRGAPRVDAVVAAINEPGCAELYQRFAPRVQAAITAQQAADWCRIIVGSLGPLERASPAGREGELEVYELAAARGRWRLKLRWDANSRITDMYLHDPVMERCRTASPGADVKGRAASRFTDVSSVALPGCATAHASMDARAGDLDGDGDLDLVVAVERAPNLVLINDGRGRFADESATRLDGQSHDSEDIGLADLDADGDLDLVFVSEDDLENQLYLNDGRGVFVAASDRLAGVRGVSNAIAVGDLDGDGDPDLVIGNAGQNEALINNGRGAFSVATAARLPTRADTTQDLELGDLDGDGDLDLVVGNEDDNRLLINDGRGVFTDETDPRLPLDPGREETREAALGDVDGDGDLDLLFANVAFREGKDPQNRLLINDGRGVFSDETAARLPADELFALEGELADLDGDGDLDVITGNWDGYGYRVLLNDGAGRFERDLNTVLPDWMISGGLDAELADLDGDGALDLYLCNYRDADYLLRGRSP